VTIDSKAKFSFAVCPNNSLKTFVLTAASDQEMNTWVNAIKKGEERKEERERERERERKRELLFFYF